MSRLLLTAAGCLLLATPLAAQPLTLRDAAAEALKRNPRVAAAESNVAAARARHDAARSSWLPLIDATANATRSNNPVFVFGSLLEQRRFGQRHFDPQFLNDPSALTNTRLSLDVRYALFDPVRRFDASPQEIVRAQSAAEEMRQQLLADVIARFYGLTVAEQRRTAAAAVRAAQLQLRGARGSLLPRLHAFASAGSSRGNSDHAVGVVARVGLFDAAKYARIAEARAGADAAQAIETMTRDKVAMEAITAWNRANAARQQLDVAAAAVVQAEAAARIVQDRYDNGLTTITELLRAQTALLGARLSLLSARHQSITGYAELLRSIGGLREIDPFL